MSNFESISSAVAYTDSNPEIRKAINLSTFINQAAKLREDIKAGRTKGISFPAKKKSLRAGSRTRTDAEKVRIVNGINNIRREGLSVPYACGEMQITARTYRNWAKMLGIETALNISKTDTSFDAEVTRLIKEDGLSITDACARHGVRMSGFRNRAIKRGDLVTKKQAVVSVEDVKMVDDIQALADSGKTVKDAAASFGLYFWQFHQLRERVNKCKPPTKYIK